MVYRIALTLAATLSGQVVAFAFSPAASTTTVRSASAPQTVLTSRLNMSPQEEKVEHVLNMPAMKNGAMKQEEQVEQVFDMLVNKNAKGAMQDLEERTERLSLDISKTTYSALMKSPPDTYTSFAEKGASNAHLPKRKILHQSILGGCYVGFGGLISLLIAGNLGGIAGASPGVAKMAFAALFPINLLLIVSTSGQLFTGNSATVAAARYEGFVSTKDMWRSFFLSLGGNIIGCALFAKAAMIAQIMNGGGAELAIKTAIAKCSAPVGATFMKAIMCNWMVSMAVFLATSANDLTGKALGCYLPISTFVGIGLEHSIANLFILPLALMLGAPLTMGTIIFKNLIPVIIGNGVAGAFIVAASYSYQFGRLGGLQRALFAEKLANIHKDLAFKRKAMDLRLKEEVKVAEKLANIQKDLEVKRATMIPSV